MSRHGNLPEFSGKDWSSYEDRLGFYFEANDIADDAMGKRRAILLTSVGEQTYTLLRSLTSPRGPADFSYGELCKLLQSHFQPKPNTILQRYNFYSTYRKSDQSIGDFVAELKNLARNCDFGHTKAGAQLTAELILEENLRDRLVCGVADPAIQRRLLGETDLDFKKALQIALAMESAAANTAQLSSPAHGDASSAVHHVTTHKQTAKKWEKKPALNRHKPCFRCGKTSHSAEECRFKDAQCRYCHKEGHIMSNCFAKQKAEKGRGNRTHQLTAPEENCKREQSEKTYNMFNVTGPRPDPIITHVELDGKALLMEVDTGATLSVISEKTLQEHWRNATRPKIKATKDRLRTYTGQYVKILGVITVRVRARNGVQHDLPLMVVPGSGPSLLGRNWLSRLELNWAEIHQLNPLHTEKKMQNPRLQRVLNKYAVVFEDSHQAVKTEAAKIYVSDKAVPKYYKCRPLPYVMRDMVNKELDRLLSEDIIEPVQYSDWAAPVVPVMKADKSVRLCGDYKLTVNQVATLDRYPIPRMEDLYAQLGKGSMYSKLDMRHAYEQIELHPSSRKFVTINTPRGLFTYKRLPYGVSSAPGIFQRVMDSLLKGIPNTMVYLDDILVTGPTEEEHLQTLELVLERLAQAGFRLKAAKCSFLSDEVEYLGHRIDAEGIHSSGTTLSAIREAPAPTNLTELRSYLGMVNHYGRFLPNLATVLAPMHQLLRKDTKWYWRKAQQEAFDRTKEMLSSPQVVTHFDSSKALFLTCDASPCGNGSALARVMEDGTERPIACNSRSLSPAEINYAQIDKEGLAVIDGQKKFHQYLWGRNLTIVTDHKPLLGWLLEA